MLLFSERLRDIDRCLDDGLAFARKAGPFRPFPV